MSRLHEDVTATLAAAQIQPSKLGAARSAGLSEAARTLYFWILRRFATGGRPSMAAVRDAAERLGVETGTALEALAREDLVHRGADGEIAVAYPFSGRPTAHRVRFPVGHEVYAMCAIDALGIASMFEEWIDVASRDPLSGEEIQVRVAPHGRAEWHPASAAVVAGAMRDAGDDACGGCCPVLNFFASAANAERWLAEHPEVEGHPVTMPDAHAAGRAVFAGVLIDAPDPDTGTA